MRRGLRRRRDARVDLAVSLALQGVIVPRRNSGAANAIYNAGVRGRHAARAGRYLPSILVHENGGGRCSSTRWALGVFVLFTTVFANDDPRGWHANKPSEASCASANQS